MAATGERQMTEEEEIHGDEDRTSVEKAFEAQDGRGPPLLLESYSDHGDNDCSHPILEVGRQKVWDAQRAAMEGQRKLVRRGCRVPAYRLFEHIRSPTTSGLLMCRP